ncbi:hypothetical protein RMCBS344292_12515 [Rhizopus microsporus]|nr:hypothetical protein RMCBS344292_12515 [Rhizopus microsporus]
MFGPAILSPENSVIAKGALPMNTNVRKILLQATRVIQNLANNVLFGAKETHMIILNDFLTANIYRVTSFLREMATLPAQYPEQSTGTLVMDQTGYIRLHTYLADNLNRISRELTSRNIGRGDTEKLLRCKKTLDRLSTLLAQLGRPSEAHGVDFLSTRNYTIANNNRTFNEFMKRNVHRDLSAIRSQHIFYLGGKSKEGRPVFYFLARTIEPESMDLELLMYYMLRAMEPYLNSPFEVLVDATGFTLANALPIHWITQIFYMMFNEINDYLVALHIYNPSTHLQRHLSKLPRPIVNRIIKRLHFYSNLDELYENFSLSEFKLSKMTLDLEKDACVTIFPVTRLTNLRTSIPVIVKIGLEEIQIITMKKQEVFYNVHAILRDIHHISEIEDITALPSSKSENGGEISIKYDRGKSTMVLASAQRDAILSHIRHSKQRYEASKPNMMHERAIRLNDVPGRLLNMALLNIGNSDPGLRLAAYNLLYSLSLSFKFNVGNQLLNAKDLCIPSNSINFIVGISERLAQNELHLTLEFLDEALVGLTKSNESMQPLCLDYMVPWLLNLGHFAKYNPEEQTSSATKTKEFIMSLIRLTINRVELYKHIQAKIWKTLAEVEEIVNLVIDCFVQCSIEYGTGSPQAEMIADTLVTMSSVSIRGKIISRMRRLIESTSFQPCRQLNEHPAWKEIAILLRFILMLSFNNTGPIVPYIPEIYHVISILVVTGPTFIRSSVHELVVNTIHTMCTMNTCLPEENVKKLHFVLNDVCDSKNRVLFGLTKQMANAFTITTETTSDYAESINLVSLQNIVKLLIDTLNYGAPTVDIANMWRARWMSLVTSTAFYFNPAIQPRSFVVLGCLAQDDVDDDLLYQILVALKGALAIFIETEPSLTISIIMCLTNIIDNLPTDSRYILHLFWLAVALVQIGHPSIFQTAVEFLHSVLRALDSRKIFAHKTIEQVLLDARIDLKDCAFELDKACGVNFDEYFSFAIAVILLKGLKQCESKDIVYHCLCSFLQIDSKRSVQQGFIESRSIGYLAGLLPFIAKDYKLKELLAVAGVCEMDVENIDLGISNPSLFDFLEIPDNNTALLLVSLLVTLLNASENESEKLFLYNLLADAANWIPEVFALIYESLLPKMNQMVINSQNQDLIEAVKNILLTACSEPAFLAVPQRRTQKWELDNLRFSSLIDPTFGAVKTNVTANAKLASKLLGAITEHQ